MSYDPRAVANLILDLRDKRRRDTTNLELQKLLYFCHAYHLGRTQKPLINGVFEAWQNGPVCPEIYHSFKKYGAGAIHSRATKKNYVTQTEEVIQEFIPQDLVDNIEDDIRGLSKLSAWQLVDLSHSKGGPWDRVVEASRQGVVAGMRIEDELTRKYFPALKGSVAQEPFGSDKKIKVKPFVKG